jgi:hypothetical protein
MFWGIRGHKLSRRLSTVLLVSLTTAARPGLAQNRAPPPSTSAPLAPQEPAKEQPTSDLEVPPIQPSAATETADAAPPALPPNSVNAEPAYYAEPLEPATAGGAQQDVGREDLPPQSELSTTTPSTTRPRAKAFLPMQLVVPEPPPPPTPRHTSPKHALWLGARLGWWVPFGDVWGEFVEYDSYGCRTVSSVPFSEYASSGPMVEVNVGARLARYYTLYVLWERAQLGGGDSREAGAQDRAETDFWGLGLRVSTDPDDLGLVLDLAVGARRFRSKWENGSELQLTDAPFESRLGLGADIRLTRYLSISPLLTLGLGSFETAEWIGTDGTIQAAIPDSTSRMTHGWLTLQMGGHFELFARR